MHKRLRVGALIAAGWLTCGSRLEAAPAAHQSPLLFLDPDANHDVILEVMKDFNTLFEKQGLDVYFQPVQSSDAANALESVSYGIISPAYEHLWRKLQLQPVLVAEANGSAYFHKVLVSLNDLPKDLSGQVVAAAVEQARSDDVRTVLNKDGYTAGSVYILAVSKDIDAMLAVTFGEANAALVTTESLAVLRQVNPSAAGRLRTLLQLEPQLRAPLCRLRSLGVGALQRDKIVQLFLHLNDYPEGKQLLQLMSVTRWVSYDNVAVK